MTKTLEEVRAKIIEAVPEIADRPSQFTVVAKDRGPLITLADVLRAIGSYRYAINGLGNIYNTSTREEDQHVARWDLSKSLDEQDRNVIEFLYRILCHD